MVGAISWLVSNCKVWRIGLLIVFLQLCCRHEWTSRFPNARGACIFTELWSTCESSGLHDQSHKEQHQKRWYDFVEVEDQSETSTIIWGRWCGQKAPPSLISKSNVLKITFKSDNYFVAKPGFKVYYSFLPDTSLPASKNNWEAITMPVSSPVGPTSVTEVPLSLDALDKTIAAFDTVEQLLKSLNPYTWKQDMDSIYTQTQIHYRGRAYHLASRHNKVDLNRLHDDVKRYSCTPRNYSINLREELRATNAVFFPRCLLVKRCGGNCGCGTNNWNSGCTCQPSKTVLKLHEVLKYAPETTLHQRHRRTRVRWVIDEIFLTHHDKCECSCPFQPPR
ncbi:platelet-derived growth factor D isoform X2 [Corythoichthys intestinalis]|uniref:platelet-derived growth factor D isoform X2 n=1 Tax=Corythoichthys intestinalis TaxID=161448 RepID=UPI0025A5AB55|nr:platelet-derived growth factor D isoform X2 [Corythoichthys intestinalis]